MLCQVGQQFAANRHAHAVDDDHQHRIIGSQGGDDLVQDPFDRHHAVTLGAGSGPVHQQPGKDLGLRLPDLSHDLEELRVGFGKHLDRIAQRRLSRAQSTNPPSRR